MASLCSGRALADISATRTSSFSYDPASGLLTQEVIEPGTPALRLQSDYTYDTFGNRASVTVSGADITTRSANTSYDARGQFAISASNALNQSESFQYDVRFGLPTSRTGPNGLTTTFTYDNFGRKTLEVRPDGTRTTWAYAYCAGIAGGTTSCPTGATYLVRMRGLAPDGTTQIVPTTDNYHDQLDRVIASDTQGLNGATIRVETKYDALGRVVQKSRPYFTSGGIPKWTTFTYDVLGRVTSEIAPDSSGTTHAYHGLSTTDTNALSQARTTVKNSQGQVVSVTDAQNQTSTFFYEPFGNLIMATDPAGNITTAAYDVRGRKVAASDPDAGSSTYTYTVLDQPKTQTDAAGLVTTLSYDLLGRLTQRLEPDLTSIWTYDTAVNGIGKLASASTNTGYSRTHTYDGFGRPAQVQLTIAGSMHAIFTGYDMGSRISSVVYPSGFAVSYGYNAIGYQTQLINSATGQPLWTVNARDAELHATQQTAGNGVTTTQVFDPNTGRLASIGAGTNGGVQSVSYTYDLLGQLLSRGDANSSLNESFSYDSLNRLASSTVSLTPTPLVKSFSYNAVGNLTLKSDVGTYTYPAAGQPRPHGVTSISGGVINTTFTYDAKGNMTGGNGLTISYTSFDKPSSITRGTTTLQFAHDPEHQRFRQISASGTTLYLADGMGSGVLIEKTTGSGETVQWNNYLMFAGGMVGMVVERDEVVQTRYFHKDHLGSISIITNETGAVLERLSYDAWGKRRNPNGTDDPAGAITSQASRGYTGHEELDAVGLVHMNGRVYDPLLARFGTPDPTTENPFSTQGWNRYSYVSNSPLNFTDPSGYCFLGCFWKPIFKAIGSLLRQIPILGKIAQIAAAVFCAPTGLAPLCAGVAAAAVTGLSGGKLGDALRAGFTAFAGALAFNVVGDMTGAFAGAPNGGHAPLDFMSEAHVFNMAGHALVGCAMAMASRAKCGPGALSGAVGSFAGPLMKGMDSTTQLVANTVLGGAASVAGGGKFANGAVTAAFGYLFNAVGDFPPKPPGYDPATWRYAPYELDSGEFKYRVIDPEGRWWTVHPEDNGHWRHWDVDDPDDPGGGGRWPENPFKPYNPNQRRLGPGQSRTDPSGDASPWRPPSGTDRAIVPGPFTPGARVPILRMPTPMYPVPAIP